MENYYSDENFTKHLVKPPREDQPAAAAHYAKIFAHPLTWEDSQGRRRVVVEISQSFLNAPGRNGRLLS